MQLVELTADKRTSTLSKEKSGDYFKEHNLTCEAPKHKPQL